MLEQEFKYYIDNQTELAKKFNNKYLVIIGDEVVDTFDSHIDAYDKSSKKYKLGTFLIQHCLLGRLSHTQTFHSRVLI